MCLSFCIHSRTGIRDCQENVAALPDNGMHSVVGAVQLRIRSLDQEPPSVRHGVPGVDRQIHDHLLHLTGVRTDRAQILRGADDELDVLADQPGQQPAHFFNDVIQIHDMRLQHLQTAESQQLTGQGRGAIGGAVDLFNLSRIVFRSREDIEEKLRVSFDDHQEIVEIVRVHFL